MKKAVLVSCFNWYKKRIEPISVLLRDRGFDVSVIQSDFDHITKKRIAEKYPNCNYIHVPSYEKNISLKRIQSHFFFGKKIEEFLGQEKPVLIYLLLPPNNTAKYCLLYKRNHPDIKLVIDIIDLWPESMPLGFLKKTPLAWIWKKWRDDAIRVADYVFTECDLYQQKLSYILNPEKASTLYLYKEQTEEEKQLVQEIVKNKKDDGIVRFAYLGSMNNIIDIDGICNVISTFISFGKICELHAIGDGESKNKFELAVKNTGCEPFFYGKIFEEKKKIEILAPCDYAFNMMKGNVSVGLTIKSIDYLSYGLPLINNIKGDTWNFVEKERVGINVGKDIIELDVFDHKIVQDVFYERFAKVNFVKSVSEVL